MDYLGYMPPEQIRNLSMIVFAGSLEGCLASAVGEFCVGATTEQHFNRLHATPRSGIEQRSGPGLLIAGIDVGAVIQQELYHLCMAAEGGVV